MTPCPREFSGQKEQEWGRRIVAVHVCRTNRKSPMTRQLPCTMPKGACMHGKSRVIFVSLRRLDLLNRARAARAPIAQQTSIKVGREELQLEP